MTAPRLSQAEYARHRGCSAVAVHAAIKAGRITLVDGKIDPAKADREWSKNSRVRVSTKSVKRKTKTELSYQDARTAQAVADAEDAQLRVLERRGVLVHVDVHRARVSQHLSALKDAFLQMPARLAAVLAAETDEAKCHNIVQDEIFSVLARLTEPT